MPTCLTAAFRTRTTFQFGTPNLVQITQTGNSPPLPTWGELYLHSDI